MRNSGYTSFGENETIYHILQSANILHIALHSQSLRIQT